MIYDEQRVYDGDEWKTAKYEAPVVSKLTRAQEQARIDILYAENKITHEQWSISTEALGNAELWTAKGKI